MLQQSGNEVPCPLSDEVWEGDFHLQQISSIDHGGDRVDAKGMTDGAGSAQVLPGIFSGTFPGTFPPQMVASQQGTRSKGHRGSRGPPSHHASALQSSLGVGSPGCHRGWFSWKGEGCRLVGFRSVSTGSALGPSPSQPPGLPWRISGYW